MISDLLLDFRHLQGLQFRNLAAVNIIVGPNNVGKTTLFRGVRAFAPGADARSDADTGPRPGDCFTPIDR